MRAALIQYGHARFGPPRTVRCDGVLPVDELPVAAVALNQSGNGVLAAAVALGAGDLEHLELVDEVPENDCAVARHLWTTLQFVPPIKAEPAPACHTPPICNVDSMEGTMSIDKQRIEAVRTLEVLGYTFAGDKWRRADNDAAPAALVPAEADALHALLVMRADELVGCTEGSDDERELGAITDAIEAYEAVRWPEGKIPGGKG